MASRGLWQLKMSSRGFWQLQNSLKREFKYLRYHLVFPLFKRGKFWKNLTLFDLNPLDMHAKCQNCHLSFGFLTVCFAYLVSVIYRGIVTCFTLYFCYLREKKNYFRFTFVGTPFCLTNSQIWPIKIVKKIEVGLLYQGHTRPENQGCNHQIFINIIEIFQNFNPPYKAMEIPIICVSYYSVT